MATFLHETFQCDVVDLISIGLGGLSEVQVVELSVAQRRTIVMFDHDLGEMYHRRVYGQFSVVLLRLDVQTIESVQRVLDSVFRNDACGIVLERSLVVLRGDKVRVTTRD